jgi:hypothetical protein
VAGEVPDAPIVRRERQEGDGVYRYCTDFTLPRAERRSAEGGGGFRRETAVSTLVVMPRTRWALIALAALGLSACEDLSMNISCPATVEVDAVGQISTEFGGDLDDLSWSVETQDGEGHAVLVHPFVGIEVNVVSDVNTDTVELKGTVPGQVAVRVQDTVGDAPEELPEDSCAVTVVEPRAPESPDASPSVTPSTTARAPSPP